MIPDRPPAPQLAATVVLLRPSAGRGEPEVLLTQRPSTMAFGADLHVYPGGRVDPADASSGTAARSARSPEDAAAALGDNEPSADALALHAAALRELAEEAGVELGPPPRLRTDLLVPIAHWVTPSFMPRRFSTWFFVADLPDGAVPVFAADEVVAHRWLTPSAALEQMASGEIAMWVPTTSVLERLIESRGRTAAEVGRSVRVGRTAPPRIVAEDPVEVRFAFGAVGGLPGRTGETSLIGERELVLLDPGDPSDVALDMIRSAVERRRGAIRAIVLSRTDPDHAAAAEALAIPLELPILVAPGAGRHLPYATRELGEGDTLPTDVDVRVRLGPPGSGRLAVVRAASAGE
ncbi:MAG TPA: NUDIX domain-containing protein [Patescibacteria group bacterium]|nr:NUDIX domain-containing protein [Patescibacteria group bacterium]